MAVHGFGRRGGRSGRRTGSDFHGGPAALPRAIAQRESADLQPPVVAIETAQRPQPGCIVNRMTAVRVEHVGGIIAGARLSIWTSGGGAKQSRSVLKGAPQGVKHLRIDGLSTTP